MPPPARTDLAHAAEEPAPWPALARLDLNHATREDLQLLPGIGPALANRIVAHRECQGPFASVRELLEVRGLAKGTVERLAPLVRAEPREPRLR